MKTLSVEQAIDLSVRILDAAGSPHDESRYVAEVLARANLAGHDSHGILRLPQYVDAIRAGTLHPGAPITVVRETRATAVLDGHQGWGPVTARRAMQLAMEKARAVGTGTVAVRGCQHVGRVGEYPTLAAAENMIGLAFVNSYGSWAISVVPWGGREARFGPNLLAFAAPSGHEWPILVDLTTSVIPEGKARLAHVEGRALPEGCLVDADGNPTTDPGVLYRAPRGALLPLGGPVGHKGTGLSLMSELLGGVLSAAGTTGPAMKDHGNGLCFQAINIADFLPLDEFLQTTQALAAWIKSAQPAAGFTEVLIPGEPEYRQTQRRRREGLAVDDGLWDTISQLATSLGVSLADEAGL